ncbi:MAG: hypothetical protein NC489_46325 [Ruminococcus flavefaciens]|nr:hypothetical protein [Ruminococcus flavefaciens]
MTRDTFKMIHSELIQQVQCIENNLRVIYAAMCKGNFESNLQSLNKTNLGKIARELEELDYSDNFPELSQDDYEVIDKIRNIRNYWCHQCYLDFVYIQNERQREQVFQRIAQRLHYDENRTYALFQKTEKMRITILNKYR